MTIIHSHRTWPFDLVNHWKALSSIESHCSWWIDDKQWPTCTRTSGLVCTWSWTVYLQLYLLCMANFVVWRPRDQAFFFAIAAHEYLLVRGPNIEMTLCQFLHGVRHGWISISWACYWVFRGLLGVHVKCLLLSWPPDPGVGAFPR